MKNDTRPHFVYRYYDADSHPLYIGCTVNPERRERDHQSKTWFSQISRREIERYESRAEGLAAEKAAIVAETPLHNVMNVTESIGGPGRLPRTTVRLLDAAIERWGRRAA